MWKRDFLLEKIRDLNVKNAEIKLMIIKKVPIKIFRKLKNGQFYETPVSARRHLSKPICRMDL